MSLKCFLFEIYTIFLLFLLLLVGTTKGLSVDLSGEWFVNIGGYVNCSWMFEDNDSLQSVKIYYGNREEVLFRPEVSVVNTPVNTIKRISGEWFVNIGGYMNCSWIFEDNDSLQFVKLYYGNREVVIFRPEIHLTELSTIVRNGEYIYTVDCTSRQRRRKVGACVVKTSVYPQPPPPEFYWFVCEVSGERPYFRVVRKKLLLKPFLAASNAVLETTEDLTRGRAKLNCTSSGLPAPNLQWKVANTLTTADFSGSIWNSTTKLWDVWSSLFLTHSADTALEVSCVPTQEESQDAQYISASYTLSMLNAARRIKGIYSIVIASILPVYLLR